MASDTKIANLALSHLGVGKMISDLTTEQGSQEAKVCREFYAISRDLVMRGFDWPFATETISLALVDTDPTDEWAFSYRYPTNCLKFRRILSSIRNDTRQSRVPYRVTRDSSGKLIYCDIEDAQAEFTLHVTDAEKYPDDFVMAVSFRLAAYIAPRITAGDPFRLGERAIKFYQAEIAMAQVHAINEEQEEEEVDSQFIRERN